MNSDFILAKSSKKRPSQWVQSASSQPHLGNSQQRLLIDYKPASTKKITADCT